MTVIQSTTFANGTTILQEENVRAFGAGLRGHVLCPEDNAYEEARLVWNGMIDRKPALIVRCQGVADVLEAVRFARSRNLLVSVRGGGHNIAGNALCDGGMTIDLSPMNAVRVDPVRKTAQVEAGALLADFDHEAQAFGLATPVGLNSTTGIAGLTLGGGFGWLSRKYGLTADNLLGADVVTAEGNLVHASADENPDLFWALRGGGGNFGIVTSFHLQLHHIGCQMLAGPIVHPLSNAEAVLRAYREFVAGAPDEVSVYFAMRHAPPLPFLPEQWHGEKVLLIVPFYAGDIEEGKKAIQPLREIGDPIADAVAPQSYVAWQQVFDSGLAPGARNYWKSQSFVELTDGMIETFMTYIETLPSLQAEIAWAHLGGAINRVPVDATAYPHRNANFLMTLHTRWEDPAQDEQCIAWTRSLYDAMTPYATGGVYVNFIPEDTGEEHVAYRANYERLAAIKARYDPDNFFRMNQNIKPAA